MASVELPVHGVSESRPDFATVSAIFDYAVATAPDTVALRHRETTLTYREEGRAVSALARRFAAFAAPGDVIALLLPNSIEFQVAYFAALRALTAPALLNPLYPRPQLEPLLQDVSPRAVVCTPATQELVLGLAGSLEIPVEVICLGHDVTITALTEEPETPIELREATPSAIGALMFSGGTTGLSKVVEHTHERLVIATRSMEYVWPTRTHGEVFLPLAPFTHIYGFLQGVLAPVFARAETVIPERFQPEQVVDLIARHRVTFFGGGPPAIYTGMLAGADLSALRVCAAGGATMPLELMDRWRNATGLEIYELYGMTEIAPISGATDISGIRPGSVGKALPCNDVQIVDLETDTRVLPTGDRGEVRVRGPHMMTGYRNRPEETAQTIRDGYIYTGDIGHLDEDGFLFLTDRKKDVVFVKGFNVFPREVEEAIHTHPAVSAVGVIGVPDERSGGERIIALVVPRIGQTLSQAEIAAHCAERLVRYKCPSDIRIIEKLPVTAAQKVDRIALRRLA